MSIKLKCIITLFVLFVSFDEIGVNCVLNDSFNDCFRLCLTRYMSDSGLRSQCIHNCIQLSEERKDKLKHQGNNTEQTTETSTSTQNNEVTRNDQDQKEQTTQPDIQDLRFRFKSKSIPETSTSIKFYRSLDYSSNVEKQIMDYDNSESEHAKHKPDKHVRPRSKAQPTVQPTVQSVPQPDHCGFKSKKDIEKNKSKLLGALGMGRVVGGVDAEEHEFPWIVSIQHYKDAGNGVQKTTHFCGGAIITKNYIITAAHCMDRFVDKESALVFKLGVSSPKDASEQDIKASKVIVHEKWDSSRQLNDIALVKVKPDIQFTTTDGGKFTVNALCLPHRKTDPVGDAVLAGWGEQAFKTGKAAEWLQKVTVPFMKRDECHSTYKKYLSRVAPDSKVEVVDTHICAGGKGGEDACRGDSGGALIQSVGRQAFQLGIVSFSVPCAIEDLPTIYTNVVTFMNWIHKQMKSH